jgi:arylsulfatase A-like enzyme
VVLLTDQQAANTLGANGNERIETPNLDALAGDAVRFENAYCTQPVCTPSRSSILTGRYPHATGCVENSVPLPSNEACLPERLGGEYTTAFMGKWHLGDEIFPQHGFDERVSTEDTYRDGYSEPRPDDVHSAYHEYLTGQGYEPDVEDEDGFERFSRTFCAELPEEHGKPAFLAREASRFIDRVEEPFVLFVSFLEPHSPFTGPRDDQYDPEDVVLPANFDHDGFDDQPLRARLIRTGITTGAVGHSGQSILGRPPTEDGWRRLIANYWGLVSLIDTHAGTIVDALDANGVADQTVVTYTSDHGDMMGSHRLFNKDLPFQEAIRVPLLLRIPGCENNGTAVPSPFSQVDLVPTLLDALGAPCPDRLQGESWVPFLDGAADPPRDTVFVEWNGPDGLEVTGREPPDGPQVASEFADACDGLATEAEIVAAYQEPVRTVVTKRGMKLNWRPHGADELYDLSSDPGETTNLIDDPAYADTVDELRAAILEWQVRTRDPVYLH